MGVGRRPRWRALSTLLLILASHLVGCGASNDKSTGDVGPVPDAPASSDNFVPDAGGDVPVVLGPPCQSEVDCLGVFAGLGPCERASCPSAAGARHCVRIVQEEGTLCEDHDLCTSESRCDADGQCAVTLDVSCPPLPCQTEPTCEPITGACAFVAAEDGGACDDGNPCTDDDVCQAGYCTPGTPVPGCACTRDLDCEVPNDACDGVRACVQGRCGVVPNGGVVCDSAVAGVCQRIACGDGACAISAEPEASPCNDGNGCTATDVCQAGACRGVPTAACACSTDADCTPFEDDDLCNGVLGCGSTGFCEVVPGSMVTCAAPGDACRHALCEPTTGLCVETAVAEGVTCDDGDACTLGDHCETGACVAAVSATCGPPTLCSGQPCSPACLTHLDCLPELGCPVDDDWRVSGPECSDGDPCRLGDACLLGICTAGQTVLSCADNNPCTTEACEAGTGCAATSAAGPCDDGDPCTVDDHCADGACVSSATLECDDTDPCTTAVCVPGLGCTNVLNSSPCEDGDICTSGDRCQAGQCRPGPKTCPCNEDANCVSPGYGLCAGTWHCIANRCVLESAAAPGCPEDGNPCTTSHCSLTTGQCGTEAVLSGSACNDGSLCTRPDVCTGGACVGGPVVSCDDTNPCTADACLPGVGCTHVNDVGPCTDTDPCTTEEACLNGECVSAENICDCKSDDDCGNDNGLCNGLARCVNNQCALDITTFVSCPDLGPCVSSVCDANTGACAISPKPDSAACSDGDPCTVADHCASAECKGQAVLCDDGNVCTTDSCSKAVGCLYETDVLACNDNDTCTADERCVGTACVGTPTECVEICSGGLDEDGNGKADCADPACSSQPVCSDCATAPVISCGVTLPGAVADDAPSRVGVTSCGAGTLADRLYRFSTTVTGPVAITLLSGADTFTLRVLTASATGTCDPGACKGGGAEVTFHAVAGHVYHVVVEKLYLGGAPGFVLAATCANACVPACAGKNCGSDGCGGVCGSCNDGLACTHDACIAGTCVSKPASGCCSTAADCPQASACAPTYCDLGVCKSVTLPECCLASSDCQDGDPCTSETCVAGACIAEAIVGCCSSAADCKDDDKCTNDVCIGGRCEHARLPGCCAADGDCPSSGYCDSTACLAGACLAVGIPGCCDQATDCHDQDGCTVDVCDIETHGCGYAPIPGCCSDNADCESPGDPCIRARCYDGSCSVESSGLCCEADLDCGAPETCETRACIGGLCDVELVPGCCESDEGCDDGNPCTTERCLGSVCIRSSLQGCCIAGKDCDDGDACTLDGCFGGVCQNAVVTSCCRYDGDCDDGLPCTHDRCAGGECKHPGIPGCCTKASDCATTPCLIASCEDGECAYVPKSGCCASNGDCATSNPCSIGTCVNATCVIDAKAACCTSDLACPGAGSPCDSPVCQSGVCGTTPATECCLDDSACPPVGGCLGMQCTMHGCIAARVDGCCGVADDCATPGIACGEATCLAPSCEPMAGPSCCGADSECAGTPSGCVVDECVDNICTDEFAAGCCVTHDDCVDAPHGPCESALCVLGRCVTSPTGLGCCSSASECPAPLGACAVRDCIDSHCVERPLPGCCASDTDCEGTSAVPCFESRCKDGRCGTSAVPDCCTTDADCGPDAPCVSATCVDGACTLSTNAVGCCVSDSDCPSAGACTRGQCIDGACTLYPEPECCESAADCAAGGPCEEVVCLASTCLQVPVAGCCQTSADCAEDANPCVSADCHLGQCVWSAINGCCAADADCSSSDPCTSGGCEAGRCAPEPRVGCVTGACFSVGFEPGSSLGLGVLSGGFVLGNAGVLVGAVDARVTLQANAPSAMVTLPNLTFGPTGHVRMSYRLDVPFGDCDGGSVRLEAVSNTSGQITELFRACSKAEVRRTVTVDASSLAGQSVRLRIVVASAKGGVVSTAVDDIVATGCALGCTGSCEDGNPCSSDVCVSGVCISTPQPGCCASDADCVDADVCTVDICTPLGCIVSPDPNCVLTACFEEHATIGAQTRLLGIGPGEGPTFDPAPVGSFSSGGHLAVLATADDVGQSAVLRLPPVQIAASQSSPGGGAGTPDSGAVVRFVLRQNLGAQCELGRAYLDINGTATALPCGSGDWISLYRPVPAGPNGIGSVSLRVDVYQAGATVEVDDIRLTGACHVPGCVQAEDCDDGNACTADGCDTRFECQHVAAEGCCVTNAECAPTGPCRTATCSGGRCVEATVAGCSAGACAFVGFEQVESKGFWTGGTKEGGPVLLGTLPVLGSAASSDLVMGRFYVASGSTRLQFRVASSFDGGCDDAHLAVLVDETVIHRACGDTGASVSSVPVGAFAGRVVTVKARLFGNGTSAGSGWIDDLRLDGACAPVGCAVALDCDDGEICTVDMCLGLECHHATNQKPCDDGDACTSGDRCSGGICEAFPLDCDDDNACTDDVCQPLLGCVFGATAKPCDDGEVCTAGDRCESGLCRGTPLLCRDFDDCTRNGCTAGVGCEFQAEPFGTVCDAGAGLCSEGICATWESNDSGTVSDLDSRLYSIVGRDDPTPMLAVGTRDDGQGPVATVFRVDHVGLDADVVATSPGASAFESASAAAAVGGHVVMALQSSDSPDLNIPPGLDLRAVASVGQTVFVGGDGSHVSRLKSTLFRCKSTPGGGLEKCQSMAVVFGPSHCGRQRPFSIRTLYAPSSQALFAGGVTLEDGNEVARVAVWDGNTSSDCDALPVHSGRVYFGGGTTPPLRLDRESAGTRESIDAVAGTGVGDVMAGGTLGTLVHFDGSTWHSLDPSVFKETALWGPHHETHAIVVTNAELHVVGDGLGIQSGGCRDGFYLHARRSQGSWVFDTLRVLPRTRDCGQPPFDRAGVRGAALDGLTGDLLVVGWTTDPAPLSPRRALVLRLRAWK